MDNDNLTLRQLVKTANRIADQLHVARSHKRMMLRKRISNSLSRADGLGRIHERLLRCEEMKQFASSGRAMGSTEVLFVELDGLIPDARMAASTLDGLKMAALRDIYLDLQATEEEFGVLRYDLDTETLHVDTEPIELDGIYLGEFRVKLHVNEVGSGSQRAPYSIEALDPHPAQGSDDVTHTHVNGGDLCAGDGAA